VFSSKSVQFVGHCL